MNALSSSSAGAQGGVGMAMQPSIGANARFWSAIHALPLDWENEAYSELCGDIIGVIDAHTATLRDRLAAQAQELAGLRARQVQLVVSAANEGEAPAATASQAAKTPHPQVEQADVDDLAECERLADTLTLNAGSPANTVAARKLHAKLSGMREAATEAQRVQSEDAISQLAISFAKRKQSFDSFQNHTHRYLAKRLGAGEATDTRSSSLRLVRAAARVARAYNVGEGALAELVADLGKAPPALSKSAAVGEALIALSGLATAGRLHLDSAGDEQLESLVSSRYMPTFFSEADLFQVPF